MLGLGNGEGVRGVGVGRNTVDIGSSRDVLGVGSSGGIWNGVGRGKWNLKF